MSSKTTITPLKTLAHVIIGPKDTCIRLGHNNLRKSGIKKDIYQEHRENPHRGALTPLAEDVNTHINYITRVKVMGVIVYHAKSDRDLGVRPVTQTWHLN